MKKRVISLLLVFCMVFSLVPTTAFAAGDTKKTTDQLANPFSDVKETDSFYDSVQYARINGIFNGTTATTFEPNGSMTRGMFVAILGRMAGVDVEDYQGQSAFSDVPASKYYAPYVAWAAKHGITNGTGDGKFSPNNIINRQQMAAFFVRYFEAFDIQYGAEVNTTTVPADLDSASEWAKEPILKLWKRGLLLGDGTNFNPYRNATRSQAARLVTRVDAVVETWYKEPGVASDRVRLDPATGEPFAPVTPSTPSVDVEDDDDDYYDDDDDYEEEDDIPTVTYYEVKFAMGNGQSAEGVTLPATKIYPENTKITLLPTPYKQDGLFINWYYDAAMERVVGSDDVLTRNMTLYAKMGEVAPVAQQETPNYITVVVPAEQVAAYTFNIKNYSDGSVEYFPHVSSLNAAVSYTLNGTAVRADYEQGQTYSVKLQDDSDAVFVVNGVEQPSTIRVLNIITEKGAVQNLALDGDVKYLPVSSVSNMTGTALDGLFSIAISSRTGEGSVSQNKNVGTFTYTGSGIEVGDTIAIYEGTRPDQRDAATQNESVAYVEITAVNGDNYTYQAADTKDVLFTPDVLPVTSQVAASSVMTMVSGTETYNVTVYQDDMQFTDDVYAQMGLDSQTTVDVGDFLAFYSGDLGEEATSNGYGLITSIAEGVYEGRKTYHITYTIADINDVMAAMDIYGTRNEEIELTQDQIRQIETDMVQQAIESGFVEEAAEYLTALAIETDGFRELSEDLDMDLSSYSITFADGTPVDPETMDLMAVKAEITEKEVSAKVILGDLVHFEDCKGVRAELVMTFKVEVGSGENKLEIILEAVFEQEVLLNVNVSGGAVWKWKWIFPYIADYELNANFDVGTFTGIGITATAKTAGPEEEEEEGFDWNMSTGNSAGDKIISIGKQVKELIDKKNEFMDKLTIPSIPTVGMEAGGDGVDTEIESSGSITSGGLAEKYSDFMENAEESWIEIFKVSIFESEGTVDPFHILCYGISADFVVSANLYVTIGMTFEYGVAKRYNFSLSLFDKKATNEVVDLEEAHYQFDFYVMGTMGIRAGIEFEVAVGLFSLKLDSIGISAEAGAYAQMWGYFYYSLSWTKSEGKNSYYAGAMCIEIGAYLSISFKAQLFSSDKLTYQPTIYENEWPLLTIGDVENVYDFGYAEDDDMLLVEVKAAKEVELSSDLFTMNYMDMKSGDLCGSDSDDEDEDGEPDNPGMNYDDDEESRFNIVLSNPKFSYNPNGNIVTINAGSSVAETCEITITWNHGTLAFSTQPIERTLTIKWSDPDSVRYIAFNSNGGSAVKMISAGAGAAITVPGEPSRIGYIFGGWYENSGCTREFSFPSTMPDYKELSNGRDKGITVYAKWIPRDDTKYTVEHYLQALNGSYKKVQVQQGVDENGAPIMVDETPEVKTGTTGALTAAVARTYDGFTAKAFVQSRIAANGSTVVKIYYLRNSYDVNFTYGVFADSNIPLTYTAKYGSVIYAPAMVLGGYEFAGFSGLTTDENGGMVVTGNATYAAQWNPSADTPYRVEHYIQRANGTGYLVAGDNAVQSLTGATGSIIDISSFAKLTDAGLTYVKATANGVDVTADTPATVAADGSTVVKLYYDRKSFDLVLMNGETTLGSTPTVYGSVLQAPTVPENPGYAFGGWYTDAACSEGNEFAFGMATMPAENLTLYIKWIARGDTPYTVEHYQQDVGGDGYTKVATESLTGTTGAETMARAKNYASSGFKDANSFEQVVIKADGSTVVKIYYDRKTYHVNFNSNEGTSIESLTGIRHGAVITAPEAPTKTGFEFAGWYRDQALRTAWDFSTDTVTAVITLYAKWEGKEGIAYTVEHYQQNVDGNGYTKVDADTENLTGKTGAQTAVQAREYEGFTAQTITQQTIKGDGTTVVEVRYTRKQYTLTFKPDNGEADTVYEDVYYGADITAPAGLTKTGYTFGGWDGTVGTMPAANTAYTAQWTPNTYTVSFNSNSGKLPSGVTVSGTMEDQSFRYGAAQALSTNAYTLSANSGYTFLGWAESEDATTADYADGASVSNLTAEKDGAVTLYAVWKQGNAVTYTVNHYQQNVTGSGYTLVDTQNPSGVVGTLTAAQAKEYEGFTAQSFSNVEITATGAVVDIYYSRNRYTLTFKPDNGQANTVSTVYYGAAITAPADPTRTGYTFAGWGTVESNMPAADTTYTAQWAANTYTVSFNSNSSKLPSGVTVSGTMSAQSFAYGTAQALTVNAYMPTDNSGYVFMGWAITADGSVAYTDGQSVSNLTADKNGTVTLYAVWELGKSAAYKVEHHRQNVDGNGYTKIEAATETPIGITGQLTAATANTYDGFTAQTIVQQPIKEDGTTVVEVKYTRNQYTLTFDANGGEGGSTGSVYYGAAITAPADPAKTGYTFADWGNVAETMPAANTTYTAQWTPNTYKVSFNSHSGKLPSGVTVSGTMADQSFTYDEAQNLAANVYTLSANSGYSFLGWATSKDAATAEFSNGESVRNLTAAANGTVTLYAVWKQGDAVAYTVKHYQQNVTGDDYDLVETKSASGIVGTLTAVAANTYEGFAAQTITQQTIAADGSTVVEVRYTRKQYTLTFKPDNGQANTVSTVYYGAAITAPEAPTKTGYTFAGWGTVAATMPAANTTYTAQWTANTYSIVFDKNAPDGVAVSGTMSAQTFTYDKAQALTGNAYTSTVNSGYFFMGWATAADGAVVYTDGQSVSNLTADKNGTVTLYAVWKLGETVNYTVEHYQQNVNGSGYTKVEADTQTLIGITGQLTAAEANIYDGFEAQTVTQQTIHGDGSTVVEVKYTRKQYTLTFAANGGTGGSTGSVYYGAAITAPTNLTKTGYTFAGWGDVAETMPAANTTYTAQWTANTYSIVFDKNAPIGVTVGGTMSAQSFTYDVEQALTGNAYTLPDYSGYTFLGWAKSAGAAEAEFADGASIKNLIAAANGTVTLYAVWKQGDTVTYTVNHYQMDTEGNYGDPIVDTRTGIKGTMTAAEANTYEGFTLATTTIDQVVIGDEAIEFNIYYSRNRYTLTFKLENGQDNVVSSVYHGAAITAPTGFTHSEEKYEFAGWDAEVPATMPMSDQTFTAQWAIKTFTVTFDMNGLDEFLGIPALGTIEVPYGSTYTTNTGIDGRLFNLMDAYDRGYSSGWYTEPEGGKRVYYYNTVTEDHTLYCRWSKSTYTISWYKYENDSTPHYKQTAEWGTPVEIPEDPTHWMTGYVFAGWDREIPETIPIGSVNICATWKPAQYKVTLDPMGAELKDNEKTFTYGEKFGDLPVLSREGYTFGGWYYYYASGKIYVKSTDSVLSDMTLFADWTANQYTITFQSTGDSTIAPIKADYGTAITPPADPTRVGYTFNGWDKEIPATMPAGDMVITAKWKATEYTITYDLDGGTNSENNPASYTVEDPTFSLAVPTRKGYAFVGWTGSNGDTPQKTVTITQGTTEDLTYTAHWEARTYTVSFIGIVDGKNSSLAVLSEHLSTDLVAYPAKEIEAAVIESGLCASFTTWYTDAECTNVFNFETDLIDSDAPSGVVYLYSKGQGVTTFEDLLSFVNEAPTGGQQFTILVGADLTAAVAANATAIALPKGSNIVIRSDDPNTRRTISLQGSKLFTLASEDGAYTTLTLENLQLSTTNGSNAVYAETAGNSLTMKDCVVQGFVGRALKLEKGTTELTGCTFTGNTGSAVYENGGTVTMTRCTFEQNKTKDDGTVQVSGGRASMTNCTFTSNQAYAGGAVFVKGTASNVVIANCTFTSNTSSQYGGGAVCAYSGEVTINQCTFENNRTSSTPGGGAVCNFEGDLKMTDCTFTQNYAGAGGAVFSQGKLVMTGCELNGNETRNGNKGGAVYVYASTATTATIVDCTFTGNKSSNGGAVYNEGGDLTMTGCTLTGNTSDYGATVFNAGGNLAMTGCTLTGNTAETTGGAVYVSSGDVTMSNCTFTGNKARAAGAVYKYNGTITMDGCTFTGNTATGTGGAVYNEGGDLTMENKCVFTENKARNGGALYIGGSQNVTLTGCELNNNTAENIGGAVCVGDSVTVTLTDCKLNSNTAACGGALYIGGSGLVTLTDCELNSNTAAQNGGAVYNVSNAPSDVSELKNCKLNGNTATGQGGAVWNGDSVITLTKCELKNNTAATGSAVSSVSTRTSFTPLVSLLGCTRSGNQCTQADGEELQTVDGALITVI